MKFHYHISLLLVAGALFSSCTYRIYPSGCDYPAAGNLVKHTVLDTAVRETSGLLYMDGFIWSFNDSGGDPVLYCLDPDNGSLVRKTVIRNATNVDWEDITEDETHLFVADVGNNFATRDTVKIYRILKSGMLSGAPEVVHDGIITVSFNGPVSRTASGYSSHDCEAVLACGDSLYLFSKNWVDETTSVYVLPKEPGHYRVDAEISYEARMLVTGADLNKENRQVSLVGYHNYMPVLFTYRYNTTPARISCGGKARIYPLKAGRQVEGICYGPEGRLFISAEKTLQRQTLFRVNRTMR